MKFTDHDVADSVGQFFVVPEGLPRELLHPPAEHDVHQVVHWVFPVFSWKKITFNII